MEAIAAPGIVRVPDGKWVSEVRVESFMKPHPEDRRTPFDERPLVVPARWWAQMLGVDASEVSSTLLSERWTKPKDYGYVSTEQNWRLVSDKPFVVVHFRDDSEHLRRQMTSSRQMHKGELGRRPELVRKPNILPSQIPDPDNEHWQGENYIQPNLNWVALSELAEIVGFNAEEIIAAFAAFSPSTFYEPNVPLLMSFHGNPRRGDITRVYIGQPPQCFCGGESYWGGNNVIQLGSLDSRLARVGGRAWVPQAFAYRVIRLVQFGYRPEDETPAQSFRIEAPMPAPPPSKLPVLPAEQLRELHPLEMELPKEHSEQMFQFLAEKALGGGVWQEAESMDDTSQGFSYCTNFRRLDLDLECGSITIAICHWTRAGADKTDNYYAGLLAVFPKRVVDPRRDPSAILRLWFFPDSLQRLVPAASKGGVCPKEVPADLAERVKRFVGGLGYAV